MRPSAAGVSPSPKVPAVADQAAAQGDTAGDRYVAAQAWRRALVYFAVCWIVSAATGTLGRLLRGPVVDHPADAAFWWSTAGCTTLILVAYWVIWPIGTLTHGRRFQPAWHLAFGLLWGLSEGQLFLSVHTLATRLVDNRWAAAGIAFVVIAAFLGVWHDRYWDRFVAPEHNIVEWNGLKVLCCHVPNLVATLSYLTVFRAPLPFVLLQTLALVGSTLYMRFPAPGDGAVNAAAAAAPTGRPAFRGLPGGAA